MRRLPLTARVSVSFIGLFVLAAALGGASSDVPRESDDTATVEAQLRASLVRVSGFDLSVLDNALQMISQGRRAFRFDTFGDEAFWGGQLNLHRAIAGEQSGGVGPGLSPRAALALGLKVDLDALPATLLRALRAGQVNLDDPSVVRFRPFKNQKKLLELKWDNVSESGIITEDGTDYEVTQK